MSINEKLANVVNRYDELEALISAPGVAAEDLVKMNKEISQLAPVVEAVKNFNRLQGNMEDAKSMMDDSSLDKEMREMAETEYYELKEKLPELEKEIKILLLPKDEDDEKNAILEVRAGTGGDEAALFAAVLFEMSQRYSGLQGWKFELLDADENGLGGALVARVGGVLQALMVGAREGDFTRGEEGREEYEHGVQAYDGNFQNHAFAPPFRGAVGVTVTSSSS